MLLQLPITSVLSYYKQSICNGMYIKITTYQVISHKLSNVFISTLCKIKNCARVEHDQDCTQSEQNLDCFKVEHNFDCAWCEHNLV